MTAPVKELTLEQVVEQARRLSADDKVRLIQRVAEMLAPGRRSPETSRPLVYGEFKGERMSTEEDFKISPQLRSTKSRPGAGL